MTVTQEGYEARMDAFEDDVSALDDEFPPHLAWSIYSNHARVAVAANETAARYAAMLVAELNRTRLDSGQLVMIGPRIEDNVNIGVRIPLFVTALRMDRHNIQRRYSQMRIAAAVDDLDELIGDVRRMRDEARDAAHAIEVLSGFAPLVQLANIAAWSAERYERASFGIDAPRDYVLLGADGMPQ